MLSELQLAPVNVSRRNSRPQRWLPL